MVTAVISDLHLGTRTKDDLLARPAVRSTLMGALASADQVVLLGDSIELRDKPPSDALAAATPFFEDLGEALWGRRVVLVPGNHDHQLADRWLARRGAGPLGLEELSKPLPGDPLHALAGRMGDTELVLAYPGVWLRPDVYATHGHYLDCHNDVRTFECLARAAVEKLTRAPRHGYSAPEDYEAVLAPVYRAIYRVGQSRRARHAASAGKGGRPALGAPERISRAAAAPGCRCHDTRSSAGSASMPTMCCSDTSIVPGRGRSPGERRCSTAGCWVDAARFRATGYLRASRRERRSRADSPPVISRWYQREFPANYTFSASRRPARGYLSCECSVKRRTRLLVVAFATLAALLSAPVGGTRGERLRRRCWLPERDMRARRARSRCATSSACCRGLETHPARSTASTAP